MRGFALKRSQGSSKFADGAANRISAARFAHGFGRNSGKEVVSAEVGLRSFRPTVLRGTGRSYLTRVARFAGILNWRFSNHRGSVGNGFVATGSGSLPYIDPGEHQPRQLSSPVAFSPGPEQSTARRCAQATRFADSDFTRRLSRSSSRRDFAPEICPRDRTRLTEWLCQRAAHSPEYTSSRCCERTCVRKCPTNSVHPSPLELSRRYLGEKWVRVTCSESTAGN